MKLELNLQYFDDPTYSVTVYKDGGFSAASASPNSSVAATTEVTLAWTLANGYELEEIEQVAGTAVTINMTTKKFKMPASNVALYFKSKANNKYKVLESVVVNINGTKTALNRNVKLLETANGAVYEVQSSGTAITLDAATVAQLVADGIIVKI